MQSACNTHAIHQTQCKYRTDNSIMQENSKDISIIKDRILKYLDYKGITMYKCYAETGISRGVLGQSNGISEENLLKFINRYEDVSIIWLMTGNGDMVDSKKETAVQKQEIQPKVIEVTPDFMLKRFEELVIENNSLKAELKQYKETTRGDYTLQNVPSLNVAESQTELDK